MSWSEGLEANAQLKTGMLLIQQMNGANNSLQTACQPDTFLPWSTDIPRILEIFLTLKTQRNFVK